MNIQFDNDQLKAVISEAILRNFDEQKRDALIQGAITHLLTPERPGYGGKAESPIERAFRDALRWQAEALARDMISNDETIKAKLKGLIVDAMERVFANPDGLTKRIADAVERGLSGDR